MPSIRESRPPAPGRQHSYSLDPGPRPGCETIWKINGQPVGGGDESGGLRVVGVGGDGSLTVEVTGDTSQTTVSGQILCPDAQPANFGPMAVGAILWDPCQLEPCKSAVDAYDAATDNEQTAARGVAALCTRLNRLRRRFLLLLGLMFGLLAAVAVCKTLLPMPAICVTIYVLALLALAELGRLYVRIGLTEHVLAVNEDACRREQRNADRAHAAMVRACPPECVLPRGRVDCTCGH